MNAFILMNIVSLALVEWTIKIVQSYFFAGLIFAVPFLLLGVQRMDSDATGWKIGFRLMILPGVCAFWPLFAVRWVRGKRTPTERNAHRQAATPVEPHRI